LVIFRDLVSLCSTYSLCFSITYELPEDDIQSGTKHVGALTNKEKCNVQEAGVKLHIKLEKTLRQYKVVHHKSHTGSTLI